MTPPMLHINQAGKWFTFPCVTSQFPRLSFCSSASLLQSFSAFLDVVKGSATRLCLKHLCTHQSWRAANHLFSCPQIPPAATLQVEGQTIMLVVDRCRLALAVGIVIDTLMHVLKNRPFIRYDNVCLQYQNQNVCLFLFIASLRVETLWWTGDLSRVYPANHSWDSSATL